MKQLVLLFLVSFAAVACDKDQSRTEEWSIAPVKGAAGVFMGIGYTPANIVKMAPGKPWELFSQPIEGFVFEEGYQSRLLVRITPVANPPADGSSFHYTMEQLLARTPSQSVSPADFSPEFDLRIASRLTKENGQPCYWVQDLRYNESDWQPFPWAIDGFAYEEGCEYTIRAKATAQYDAHTQHHVIHYTLKEELSCEQKESDKLPE